MINYNLDLSQKNIIYLDNQASTKVDDLVLKRMHEAFVHQVANPHSTEHLLGQIADKSIENAKEDIKNYMNASLLEEIIITSGATESNNMAIIGTAYAALEKGLGRKRILVSAIEHKCVLASSAFLEKFGFKQEVIPVDHHGLIDMKQFEEMLSNDVLLVSIMSCNNEIGVYQNILELSDLCKKYQVIFHVDASQSAYYPLESADWDLDLVSISAHKIYGPKGVGALFINQNNPLKPLPILYGGYQQDGYRAGTLSTPLIIGFAEACKQMMLKREEESKMLLYLRDVLHQGLLKLDSNLKVNATLENRHPGNLNITFSKMDSKKLISNLQFKVALSSGSACNSGFIESSHVLKAIRLSREEISRSMRISIGRYNTEQEISQFLEYLASFEF